MLDYPGIEQRNADRLEVGNVAGHNRQTVNHRRRGNQGIAFRARIGNMKTRATLRHRCVDSQDATLEARQDLFVDPGADYLKDHFPGFPMLPGLLMLEASVRTAAALWAASAQAPSDGAVLEHVDRLQLVRRVIPGETLRLHVTINPDPDGHRTACFAARGVVNGETAVRASFRLRAATEKVTP